MFFVAYWHTMEFNLSLLILTCLYIKYYFLPVPFLSAAHFLLIDSSLVTLTWHVTCLLLAYRHVTCCYLSCLPLPFFVPHSFVLYLFVHHFFVPHLLLLQLLVTYLCVTLLFVIFTCFHFSCLSATHFHS